LERDGRRCGEGGVGIEARSSERLVVSVAGRPLHVVSRLVGENEDATTDWHRKVPKNVRISATPRCESSRTPPRASRASPAGRRRAQASLRSPSPPVRPRWQGRAVSHRVPWDHHLPRSFWLDSIQLNSKATTTTTTWPAVSGQPISLFFRIDVARRRRRDTRAGVRGVRFRHARGIRCPPPCRGSG